VAIGRSVVLNGDLGSGKTSVSTLLAERLGVPRVSVGDVYRAMAVQRGMTALQLNLHAELDDKIDHYVDRLQADIAASGEQLVVDSRLAWHFFAAALKVHLITEPAIAAQRVLDRPADEVESYTSLDEARERLAARSESERSRFLSRYGVDKTRLRNYDLVCDTTSATPGQVVDCIVEHIEAAGSDGPPPSCHLDPRRIFPTAAAGSDDEDDGDTKPIAVGYARPNFFVVEGHRRLSAAIRAGLATIRATLVAEADETVAGQRCEDYFRDHATADLVGEWRATHGVALTMPVGTSSTM
jgi:CMP/dCMP kinase